MQLQAKAMRLPVINKNLRYNYSGLLSNPLRIQLVKF